MKTLSDVKEAIVGWSNVDGVVDTEAAIAIVDRAILTLSRIDVALRVPAAEYVPAIRDVFDLIDDFDPGIRSRARDLVAQQLEEIRNQRTEY